MKSAQSSSVATLFVRGVVVVLIAASALGCTTRKQYAINEAILISERRHLEDEIYRVQFELRDALEDNERLRRQIDKQNGVSSEKPTKTEKTSARIQPFDEREYDNSLFPGGTELNVVPGKPKIDRNSSFNTNEAIPVGSYEGSEVEMLPDNIAVPNSRKSARATAPKQRRPREYASSYMNPIDQASYAARQLVAKSVGSAADVAIGTMESAAKTANAANAEFAKAANSAVNAANAANTEFAKATSNAARKVARSVSEVAAGQYDEESGQLNNIAEALYEEPIDEDAEEGYYEDEEEYCDSDEEGSEEDEDDNWAPVAQ